LPGPALLQTLGGRIREHAVGGRDDDRAGAGVLADLDGLGDRSAGVDEVVYEHAIAPLDLADHAVGHGAVRPVDVAGLVHEREWSAAELGGPLLRHPDAAGIGRYDGHVAGVDTAAHVVGEDRHGPQVIDRPVEEALGL